MAELNINKATLGNLTNVLEDYKVGAKSIDSPADQKENIWENTRWNTQLGYYTDIPELKSAIDARATWTIGKGFKADPTTAILLDKVDGWGVDNFDSILRNMIIISQVNGDSYAQIIRSTETGIIENILPIDPEGMVIITSREGRIIRYEKHDRTTEKGKTLEFNPEEILHFTKDRIASQIHGTSIIDSVEWIILARNEAMEDYKKLMHRNVKPIVFFQLDEDNETKIAEFVVKMDKAIAIGENIYVPRGSVGFEILSVPPSATLNPLSWIDKLTSYFYSAVRMPQIIVGASQEFTEATAKIAYLAFQQNVEEFQREIEQQVWEQLGLRIELTFPASLENELLSDQNKDKETGVSKPSDTRVNLKQD